MGKKRRLSPILTNTLLTVASVAVALLTAEGATRIYAAAGGVDQKIQEQNLTPKQFRLRQPEPYKNSAYFSREFLEESFKQPGSWFTPPGTRIVLPQNFHGKFFNVSHNLRETTDRPSQYQHTIYILGGSTVYNSEVPDNLTWSSQLQRLINQRFPNRYQVLNYGVTTIKVSQQVERLKTIALKPGDVVIFYDGVNDIYQTMFDGHPEGWIVGQNRAKPPAEKLKVQFFDAFKDKSKLVELFLNPYAFNLPKHLQNVEQRDKLLAQLRSDFQAEISSTSEYTQQKNASFFHFLQPQLFTDSNLTDYEKSLLRHYILIPPGLKESFKFGYPVLKEVSNQLNQQGVKSYDISFILDSRTNGEEYYLDMCHVTEKANGMIASSIFSVIRSAL